ncbi:helix-turn-helix domain-containing protein [Niveibacterium sp. SC-1]|uniref:AraC family transcriptional regulator n=1 Tax=Niveibacterium sp. SC-1 TaxID=3135646 RepID=UPI00311E5C69
MQASASVEALRLTRSGYSGVAQDPYGPRLNRAMDYVDAHLADELGLSVVAGVAAFSEGHFHRLFKMWTRETLNQFIQRRRLETAALRLRHNRWESVTQVAQGVGFATPETFARAFRRQFGMSATDWRKFDWVAAEDAFLQDAPMFSEAQVSVRKCPDLELRYWRMHGRYEETATLAWQRFTAWLPTLGLGELALIGTGVDDPSITPDERCRYDTCVVVPPGADAFSARASRKTAQGGWYACMGFRGERSQIRAAWHWLKSRWLPASGFSLGTSPFLECYVPGATPLTDDGLIEAELRMPIRP